MLEGVQGRFSETEDASAMAQVNNHIDNVGDPGAVKNFYRAVFGWTFKDWGPDYIPFYGAGLDGGLKG